MKNKVVEYLPLSWAKRVYHEDVTGVVVGDPAMLRQLLLSTGVDKNKWDEASEHLTEKYPDFVVFMNSIIHQDYANPGRGIFKEALNDFNFMSNVSLWSRDKQVFKFDKDFIEELINTDNLRVPTNAFAHLPFKHIYVDISDCKEVCDKVLCSGFFLTVDKMIYEGVDSYAISAGRVSDKYFFSDILVLANDGKPVKTDIFEEITTLNILERYNVEQPGSQHDTATKEFHFRMFNVLIVQILLYLSSVKADIVEDEDTKKTYRKPLTSTKPKNKFSEIRKWNVGIRFGSSVRKWKERKLYSNVHKGTGTMKRPHTRRAHWHSYRYKNDVGEYEWRPVWIEPIFVNERFIDKSDIKPTVVHKN